MTKSPLFQHRHYCKIAAIIAAIQGDNVRADIAEHFSYYLQGTNPNYSRERFAAAAHGEPNNGRDSRSMR